MPTFREEALAQEAYGEITLWGIFSNIFSFSVIICTLYLFDKGCAFYFEFHFLCLGFIILTFTKLLLFEIKSRNHEYIYDVHMYDRAPFLFQISVDVYFH